LIGKHIVCFRHLIESGSNHGNASGFDSFRVQGDATGGESRELLSGLERVYTGIVVDAVDVVVVDKTGADKSGAIESGAVNSGADNDKSGIGKSGAGTWTSSSIMPKPVRQIGHS
jgi:hypothetical protein